ncbi:MAG: peptidylprolyl isomerase [Clostridia bacterium]|nr:peptidylprolyl isomerase [Clostridia bacterium]
MFQKHSLAKKIMSVAGVAILSSSALFMTGCETKRPEAEIDISFNGTTYTVSYQLYRNLYPQTVRHFVELAESGYYDGLCVHNYTTATLYTGGYTYNAEQTTAGGLTEKNYFSIAPTLNLTSSVFDSASKQTTYTLYGEFTDNGYKVSNNAQTQKFGSLVMYYTPKDGDNTRVTVTRSSDGENAENKHYKYNSATSLFYIFTGVSGSNNSSYCTFGQLLNDDAKKALENLQSAIEDYVDTLGETSFTEEVTVRVDSSDPYVAAEKTMMTYQVPTMPIIVEAVRITKY